MRMLFLTPDLPFPPQKGTSLRNWHLLRHLAARHEVDLLSFSGSEGVPEPLARCCGEVVAVPAPGRSTWRRALSFALSGTPDLALRRLSPLFQEKLREMMHRKDYDLVQVEGLELAPYLFEAARLRAGAQKPLLVLDEHNAEFMLQRSAFEIDSQRPRRWPRAAYSYLQWRRLRRYEAAACRQADAVIAVSPEDREHLLRLEPNLRVSLVPNGVDSSCYEPAPALAEEATVVFTGSMDYRPNVDAVAWFAREVFPLVLAQVPEARFLVVGARPAAEVARLAGRSVAVVGAVPDVRPYLQRAMVYVVPMRMGSGVRFKLLEAMACGVAIASTRLGAAGVAAIHGSHLLLADDAPGLAGAVVCLLRDQELGARLGAAARLLVERAYDWRVILPSLDRLYQELAA